MLSVCDFFVIFVCDFFVVSRAVYEKKSVICPSTVSIFLQEILSSPNWSTKALQIGRIVS